jgi:hypothetical protein
VFTSSGTRAYEMRYSYLRDALLVLARSGTRAYELRNNRLRGYFRSLRRRATRCLPQTPGGVGGAPAWGIAVLMFVRCGITAYAVISGVCAAALRAAYRKLQAVIWSAGRREGFSLQLACRKLQAVLAGAAD